jgi:cell fate regulator YaaT (PSP1 superfamily)
MMDARVDAKNAATTDIGVYKYCRKRLCCSAFFDSLK